MDKLVWVDYSAIALSIAVPFVLGLYHGLKSRYFGKSHGTLKRNEEKRFLRMFPVFMSLTASNLSGIAIIGIPIETYLYGMDYLFYLVATRIPTVLLNNYCFLPILYNLKIDSAYEYFEIRFDARVRKLASFIFIITQVAYAAIAIYPAATVLSQFSSVPVDVTTYGLTLICAIVAAAGGFKGVVWSDTYQGIVMWLCLIAFLGLGYVRGGGFWNIYEMSKNSGRFDVFLMDLDPTLRLSFWSGITGLSIVTCSYSALNPASFQRYSSLKTLNLARRASIMNAIQVSSMLTLLSLCGLAMYSSFHGCDPKLAGIVDNYLNNVTYFISLGGETIIGLKGLFIAGIFCGSLSTMSTNMNTAATLMYTEFVKNWKVSSRLNASTAVQLLTLVAGVLSMCLVALVKGANSLIEVFQKFVGGVAGQSVGLFILGMFCLPANSQGSFWGGLLSLCIMAGLLLGSKMYSVSFARSSYFKPLSTEQCAFNVTKTIESNHVHLGQFTSQEVPAIFRITPHYYPVIATVATVVLGLSISWLTREPKDRVKLKEELFSPGIRKLFKERFYSEVPANEESSNVESKL